MIAGRIAAVDAGAGPRGRAARGGLERALIAAGVGAAVGFVLWLAIILIKVLYLRQNTACQQSSLACLAAAAAAVGAALAALALLAWPLLRIAGVRPAWPVALAAPPVAFIVGRGYQALTGNPAGRVPDGIVILMISYAVAALLTTPGVWHRRR